MQRAAAAVTVTVTGAERPIAPQANNKARRALSAGQAAAAGLAAAGEITFGAAFCAAGVVTALVAVGTVKVTKVGVENV